MARADQGECDLIARSSKKGEGFLYSGGVFLRDKAGKPALTDAQVRDLAHGSHSVTYTCAPPGNGTRLALDRDLDGTLDGDE